MRYCLRIVCCGVVALLFGLATAGAQDQLGTKEELTKVFSRDSARWNKLFAGEEQATAGDKKIAEAAAQWYIYRITHRSWPMLTHEKVQAEFNSLANTAA